MKFNWTIDRSLAPASSAAKKEPFAISIHRALSLYWFKKLVSHFFILTFLSSWYLNYEPQQYISPYISKNTSEIQQSADRAHFRPFSVQARYDASVYSQGQLLLSSLPLPLQARAQTIIEPVLYIAKKHQMDPLWVLSVIWTESHFRAQARSSAGAYGFMQIMPKTFSYLEKMADSQGIVLESEKNLAHLTAIAPQYKNIKAVELRKHLRNLELGMIYLKYLLVKFESPILATIAYNMGPRWLRIRLKKGLPVGNRNRYLSKVKFAYSHFLARVNN